MEKETKAPKTTKPKALKAKKEEVTKKLTILRLPNILIEPRISEKAAILGDQGKYTFLVQNSATKIQIKKAFAERFGIMPKSVNVTNYEGKKVRRQTGIGQRSSFKKATINLDKNQKVELF